jgi:hypothetical protein
MRFRELAIQTLLLWFVAIFGLWSYWHDLWPPLTIARTHLISPGPYFALGIAVEILIWSFLIAFIVLSVSCWLGARRFGLAQFVWVLTGAIGVAWGAVMMDAGLRTSRGLLFKAFMYVAALLLSSEASVLPIPGGYYAPETERGTVATAG